MVEKIRAGERIQHRARLRDTDESAHVEGLRPHRRVFRPADGLQELQDEAQGGQPYRGLLQKAQP